MKKKVLGKNELNQHYPIHYGPGKSKLAIKEILKFLTIRTKYNKVYVWMM